MNKPTHIPVLLSEVLEFLPQDLHVVVDGTLGLGGHALAILEQFSVKQYIGFDKDSENAKFAQERLEKYTDKFIWKPTGFEDMADILPQNSADAVLLDLGLCSSQIDFGEKRFSFQDGPLDMRFGSEGLSASDIMNHWEEEQIKKILWEYAEEKFAGRIARAIVEKRPLQTTQDLVKAIESVKYRTSKTHPATQTFQALRIAVNDELQVLERGLESALQVLKPDGRLLVISYHSLEDRIVKNFFRKNSRTCTCPPGSPICTCNTHPALTPLTKKPIQPTEEETQSNPRARSAKLRIATKN
jgi:16S rRNA (cytosine1402-N4)-methyltransferase